MFFHLPYALYHFHQWTYGKINNYTPPLKHFQRKWIPGGKNYRTWPSPCTWHESDTDITPMILVELLLVYINVSKIRIRPKGIIILCFTAQLAHGNYFFHSNLWITVRLWQIVPRTVTSSLLLIRSVFSLTICIQEIGMPKLYASHFCSGQKTLYLLGAGLYVCVAAYKFIYFGIWKNKNGFLKKWKCIRKIYHKIKYKTGRQRKHWIWFTMHCVPRSSGSGEDIFFM